MNRHVAGLLALAVALGGVAITVADYRRGQSRFWLSGGINIFSFDRATAPAFFWLSTALNGVVIALVLLGGLAATLIPGAGG